MKVLKIYGNMYNTITITIALTPWLFFKTQIMEGTYPGIKGLYYFKKQNFSYTRGLV